MEVKEVSEGNPEGELVFHYKRGSFREREDQATRDMATGKTVIRHGLFKSLVSTRGNRLMFFTLVAVAALCFVVGFLDSGNNKNSLSGVDFSLQAFSFNDEVYVSLEMKDSEKNPPSDNVEFEVEFKMINEQGGIQNSLRVNHLYEKKSENKPSFVYQKFSDYDILRAECYVFAKDGSIALKTDIKRN